MAWPIGSIGRSGLLTLLTVLIVTGCAKMNVQDFKDNNPVLVLEDYFEGSTKAYGLFEDRFGTVRRQFTVDIEGTVDGDSIKLIEDFLYDDGETEQRIWLLTRKPGGRYEGHAEAVIGTATGQVAGNAFNWQYTIDLKMGDSTWRVDFDDWMFLQKDGVLLNKAVVSKWGFTIGTVTLAFRKPADEQSAEGMNHTVHAVAAE